MAETCSICDEIVETDRRVVREKGMQGLLKASIARKDGKEDCFRGKESVVVHVCCQKQYTRPQTIAADLRKASSQPSTSQASGCTNRPLRSSELAFSFQTKCFFCTEDIDEEFHKKQKRKPIFLREKVYSVRSTELKKSVLERADKRGDKLAEEVSRRIINVSDLIAADAIYHDDCCKQFFSTKMASGTKRGRPLDDSVSSAMEEIYTFLDGNNDCQYSLDEIMGVISGEKPSQRTIKNKLKEKYGDRVIITELHSRRTVICFRDVGERILTESWYTSRCDDEQKERIRIVQTAAAILLKDIQSQAYETKFYPASDGFLNEAELMVPETLLALVEALLLRKKGDQEKVKKKVVSISHAIIEAVRPRSFVSPILHGLALLIHRKYGSRSLVNLLASLGFSASYYDAQKLELSAIHHPQQPIPSGIFCQYVFDNADFNVATIDGLKTFHSMGGIRCLTPVRDLPPAKMIEKVTSVPSAETIGRLGVLPLQTFENVGRNGLKNITVKDMNNLHSLPDVPVPSLLDVLWMTGKWLGISGIPEWKGCMRSLCEEGSSDRSAVLPLPFINAPPSDYNTIYTALKYATQECQQYGIRTCYVTFDQPLYIKAREIVASCPSDLLLTSVVVRLGGFHLLMSFLGCIGHTMAGSGLKEVLCTIFAVNSVDKMLAGHAFRRAVRGHLLVQTVLAQIILNSFEVSNEVKAEITEMLSKIKDKTLTQDELKESAQLASLQEKLKNELNSLKENGPTATLWVQYFHMVSVMKHFIAAERSGDWESHLCSVQQIIPFFHGSGHLQYAKCAHLYLQDMRALQTTHPFEFETFTQKGYFTISRSDSPGSGVWSDMTIEQTLMRSMKSSGGLTRGRGITDSVLAKWVGGTAITTSICSSLEDFAGLQFSTGEQHVDCRTSRQTRDEEDRKKLSEWFSHHPPFPKSLSLVSLATGVVGNCNVNCHKALEVGKATMAKLIGQNFGEVKQNRKDKVLSLASMSSTVKINNVVEVVDPLLIFQRIAITKKSDEDLQDLLKYELAPFPLALFNENGMRKTKKSALYEAFPVEETALDLKVTANVIDGGFLLHRVKWSVGSTFSCICKQYVTYVKNHYGNNCTVVFDGYNDTTNSTKRAEQKRRGGTKTSVDINFDETMRVTVQQEHFLTNENNKSKLIHMLSQKMIIEGIETTIADGDADTSIVRCGVDKATNCNTAIIGEDVDLLVLLIALAPSQTNLFFVKPGRGKVETKTYSSLELQKLGNISTSILFIHAFSGCDTTSSVYRKGKAQIVNIFGKDERLRAIADVFYGASSTPEEVSRAGEQMFLALYQAREHDLNSHRYSAFLKSANKVKPDLPSLPPTKGSAQQHAFRVFLQVQQWLGNHLPPEKWGWIRGNDGALEPLTTKDSAAPDSILNTIFCRCAADCGGRCGCRKAGIKCTLVGASCQGTCTNGIPPEDEELDENFLAEDEF